VFFQSGRVLLSLSGPWLIKILIVAARLVGAEPLFTETCRLSEIEPHFSVDLRILALSSAE